MNPQEQLFNDLRNLDLHTDNLCNLFQNSFEKLVEDGSVTRDHIKESFDNTMKSFDNFIDAIKELKKRAAKVIEYHSEDPQRRKELDLLDEINKAEELASKYIKELDGKRKELTDVCSHTNTKVEEKYIPGGYLEREEYIKRLVCTTCGKQLDEKREQGSFG